MKKLLALIAPLFLSACLTTPGMLPISDTFEEVTISVVQRHDAYVIADEGLLDAQRADALADAEQVMVLVTTLDEVSPQVLSVYLEPVLVRHDAYVSADASLDLLHRDQYLASSDAVYDYLTALGLPE